MEKKVKKGLLFSIFLVAIFLVLMINVESVELPEIETCRDSALVDVYTGRYECIFKIYPLPDPLICIMNLNARCLQTGGTPLGGTETGEGESWNKTARSCEIRGCLHKFLPLLWHNRKCWILCMRGAQYQGSQDTTLYHNMWIRFKKKEGGPANSCNSCYNEIPCDTKLGWTQYRRWCKIDPYNDDKTSCVNTCVLCQPGYINRDGNWENGCEPEQQEEIFDNCGWDNAHPWVDPATKQNCPNSIYIGGKGGCVRDLDGDGKFDQVCCVDWYQPGVRIELNANNFGVWQGTNIYNHCAKY